MKKLNNEKLLKVYKVTFGEVYKGEDMSNIDSKTIFAETCESAMTEARLALPKKYRNKCYIQEVELLNILSQYED